MSASTEIRKYTLLYLQIVSLTHTVFPLISARSVYEIWELLGLALIRGRHLVQS